MGETCILGIQYKGEYQSSDDGESLDGSQPVNNNKCFHVGKLLTSASFDSLCKLIKEQQGVPALTCLINAYRAACHNDSEATGVNGCILSHDHLLRSTVFLLNQVTDSEILAFSICRLRASLIFLSAFPSLLCNLLESPGKRKTIMQHSNGYVDVTATNS
ncbi:hypothetical protein RJT34_26639 [Clitoria ternatea]|uniref:Uncharacterized protein n=1 Tax=Clitoria ternatea TaxID=43366 RepID=A0AAN9F7G8_CLITE